MVTTVLRGGYTLSLGILRLHLRVNSRSNTGGYRRPLRTARSSLRRRVLGVRLGVSDGVATQRRRAGAGDFRCDFGGSGTHFVD